MQNESRQKNKQDKTKQTKPKQTEQDSGTTWRWKPKILAEKSCPSQTPAPSPY